MMVPPTPDTVRLFASLPSLLMMANRLMAWQMTLPPISARMMHVPVLSNVKPVPPPPGFNRPPYILILRSPTTPLPLPSHTQSNRMPVLFELFVRLLHEKVELYAVKVPIDGHDM